MKSTRVLVTIYERDIPIRGGKPGLGSGVDCAAHEYESDAGLWAGCLTYIASNTAFPGYRRICGKVVALPFAFQTAVIFCGWVVEKISKTPIKDNIAKHRAAHNISDVLLWTGCAMTGA